MSFLTLDHAELFYDAADKAAQKAYGKQPGRAVFACPNCGQPATVTRDLRGGVARCDHCKVVMARD